MDFEELRQFFPVADFVDVEKCGGLTGGGDVAEPEGLTRLDEGDPEG